MSEDRLTALIERLRCDPDMWGRREAALTLGGLQDTRAVGPLLEALEDPRGVVAMAAADALVRCGAAALPVLASALRTAPSPQRRQRLVHFIGAIGSAWRYQPGGQVIPECIDLLVAALADEDTEVRRLAAGELALYSIPRERILSLLTVEAPPHDARAVAALIAALADVSSAVRVTAAWTLAFRKEALAVGPLIAALRDGSEEVRVAAVEALGKLGDSRAVPGLVAALDDRSEAVRATAIMTLGALGDSQAVPALIDMLVGNRLEHLRCAAIEALSRLGDRRAAGALNRALRGREPRVRDAALTALLAHRDWAENEAEILWLSRRSTKELLGCLPRPMSFRKWVLLAVACCRQTLPRFKDTAARSLLHLSDVCRQALDVAARAADGQATEAEVTAAWRAVTECSVTARQQSAATTNGRAKKGFSAVANFAEAVAAVLACLTAAGEQAGPTALPAGDQARALQDACGLTGKGHMSLSDQVRLEMLRDLVGNPFQPVCCDPAWLVWHDGTVVQLARAIQDEGSFEQMPILGDALEEAGCTEELVLTHCRGPNDHLRGCWVLDLILCVT
jgi:HEAT repeat protein